MNRIFAVTVLSALIPALALAHGPSRKKEVTTVEIDAPADKVWGVIGNYRDMSWHPAIASAEVTPGELKKEVTKRKLTFKSGAVFTDTLTRYDPATRTLAFLTNDEDLKTLPVEGYSSTFTVTDDAGKAKVEWKGAFYRGYMNNDPPPELSDEAAQKAIAAFQKEGLDALKAKLRRKVIGVRHRGRRTNLLAVAVLVVSLAPAARGDQAREAFVTNQLSNTIGVVDLAAQRQVAEIVVSGAPAGVAMSPTGDFAYITAPDGRELIAIDAALRAVAWRLNVGEGPLGIAVNPPTGVIYVANWYGDEIVAVDPGRKAIVNRVKVGRAPSGLAVTPDGALLISADRESDAISLIDTKAMQRLGEVKVGTHPFGLAIEPDGKRAFIANVISNDVTIIDLATRKVTATLSVGTRPYGIAFAGGKAFVTNQGSGSVSVFGTADLNLIATVRVGDYPEGIAATDDGSAVYVACWSDNVLVRIDAATLAVTGKTEVGDGPRAFGKFLR